MEGFDDFLQERRRYILRKWLFIAICAVVTVVAIILEIGSGKYDISFSQSLDLFIKHLQGVTPPDAATRLADSVVWGRVPRAIGAIGIGAILGMCGCAMQSSMKNPLADPYLTGIASGASLGVALVVILGVSVAAADSYDLAIMANAFVFALIPAAVMVFFTLVKRNISTSGVMLVGIAVMFFFTAITTMLKYIASDSALADIYYWNVGTINNINWSNYLYILAFGLACLVVLQYFSRQLNILTLNDENAQTLGVDPRKIRTYLLVVVSLFTAIAVSYTGTIGFVGLVGPHVCRMFLGSDNKYLIPASAMSGAMILLAADCLAKNLTMGGLPVGVITSLVGGPLFLFLLIQQKKNIW